MGKKITYVKIKKRNEKYQNEKPFTNAATAADNNNNNIIQVDEMVIIIRMVTVLCIQLETKNVLIYEIHKIIKITENKLTTD